MREDKIEEGGMQGEEVGWGGEERKQKGGGSQEGGQLGGGGWKDGEGGGEGGENPAPRLTQGSHLPLQPWPGRGVAPAHWGRRHPGLHKTQNIKKNVLNVLHGARKVCYLCFVFPARRFLAVTYNDT
jgi:hypothetical protein